MIEELEMPAVDSVVLAHANGITSTAGANTANVTWNPRQWQWTVAPGGSAYAIRGDYVKLENQNKEEKEMASRRLVQVFVVDPDERVPLEDALLYKGEQKFTDETDQELFFGIGIVPILGAHNAKRLKVRDDEASDRAGKDVFLKEARIRDLRMVVVTIAGF